jgi:hypothetical protein
LAKLDPAIIICPEARSVHGFMSGFLGPGKFLWQSVTDHDSSRLNKPVGNSLAAGRVIFMSMFCGERCGGAKL